MNKLFVASALAMALGSALAQPDPALHDRGYATYRQAVLGASTLGSQGSTASTSFDDRRVAGSYARYLMYLGDANPVALAKAALAGETAAPQAFAAPGERPEWNSYERYQRTVLGRSDAELLASRSTRFRRQASAGTSLN